VLKALTDPNGNVTTFERDIQGRPTARVYADGSRETYAYEPSTARLKSRTDPLGQRTDYAYARDDRVSAVDYAGALEPTAPLRFTYDPAYPRLTQRIDGDGTTAYTYHPAGSPGALRLAQEDGPFANDTLAYTYDALGRVQTRTVDAVADTYAYDVLGRLVGHATPLAEFAYDYLGATPQRTRRSVVGNAVAACPGSVRNEHAAEHNTCTGIGHACGIQRRTAATLVSTWQYADNLHDRRLESIQHQGGAAGADPSTLPRSYAYLTDPENRLLGQTESVAGTPTRSWTL
jgi:YD repeat-containing protein